jgi:hypothetical protein
MKNVIYLFLTLFSANTFGQKNAIIGAWRTPVDFSTLSYTFDSLGYIDFKLRGCMNTLVLNGKYTVQNDSIFIQYDTLTPTQRTLYQIKDRRISYIDTLIYINQHKIQLAPNAFIYNEDRDEQECKITPNGLFTFKIKHFGDTFTIKQYNYSEWVIIDTLINPNNEYIDLVNYPLFLHSGTNKFKIYINNRVYFNIIIMDNSFGNEIIVEAQKVKVKIEHKSAIQNYLNFSDTTIYEVQDTYGNKILAGKGRIIDCKSLPKGKYILNFDNQTTEFVKL